MAAAGLAGGSAPEENVLEGLRQAMKKCRSAASEVKTALGQCGMLTTASTRDELARVMGLFSEEPPPGLAGFVQGIWQNDFFWNEM